MPNKYILVYILEQYDRQSLRLSICDLPSCSTPDTVQLIIIDLLHSLVILLEVLVIVLTLCVQALLIVIRCHCH